MSSDIQSDRLKHPQGGHLSDPRNCWPCASGSTGDITGYSTPSIRTYQIRDRPVVGDTILIVPDLSTQEIMSRYEVSDSDSAHDPVTKIAAYGGGGGTLTVAREVHGDNGGIPIAWQCHKSWL